MVRVLIAGLALALVGGAAEADVINVFDKGGAPLALDTAKVENCRMFFDSSGEAFEICRLAKVELRPPQSTRVRPGQSAERSRAEVVYTKTGD